MQHIMAIIQYFMPKQQAPCVRAGRGDAGVLNVDEEDPAGAVELNVLAREQRRGFADLVAG